MTSKCDAVVIGAGVIGSSVAYELARKGLSVIVVDKAAAPGLGSTSSSSAVIRFNYSTYDAVTLSWEPHFTFALDGDEDVRSGLAGADAE